MNRGQAPTSATDDRDIAEILIAVALVALAVIGVAGVFGEQIQELFSGKPPEVQATAQPAATAPTRDAQAAPAPQPPPTK